MICESLEDAIVLRNILFFFFNDAATTEIYTLSLHDALPIFNLFLDRPAQIRAWLRQQPEASASNGREREKRSEEHTSELQSQSNLVCRLLLEKKKKKIYLQNSSFFRHKRSRVMLHINSRMYK